MRVAVMAAGAVGGYFGARLAAVLPAKIPLTLQETRAVSTYSGVVIAAAIYGALAARKRREALSALAARLGLNFNPEEDSVESA